MCVPLSRRPRALYTPAMSTSTSLPWRRVIVEFLVIVAGVSVGLFADDWRTSREDRRLERNFLVDLHSDLIQDSIEFEAVLQRMGEWDVSSLDLYRSLDQPSVTPGELAGWFDHLNGISSYEPSRSAYERMKATGRMGFLDDRGLQAAVTDYFERTQPYALSLIERTAYPRWEAWRAHRSAWLTPRLEPTDTTWWPNRGEEARQQWILTAPWEAFRSDPELPSLLQELGRAGGNVRVRYEGFLDENTALRHALAETLGR